jgi:hypothetical protein
MRAGIVNRDTLAAMVMAVVALGGLESVRAGGPAEKLQFSEVPSQSAEVVSNLDKLNPNPTTFNQVKEDLLRPFNSMDPRNSLDMDSFVNGQFPPPQQPNQPMMSRHMQQLLDEKKNWAFSAYEALFSGTDDVEKQMFGIKQYGDDGREKKDFSTVEKYYNSLDRKNLSVTNQNARAARAEFINENGFDPLGKTFDSSDPFMRRMFGFEDRDSVADKATSGGILPKTGVDDGDGTPVFGSPQEVLMTQKRLQGMQSSVLGDSASKWPKFGEQFNPLLPSDYYAQAKNPADDLFNQQLKDASEIKEKPANQFLAQDPMANVLHSHINDDLTARALGLPNPVVSATNNARPAPTAQSIQAEWDPFGANRPKPRF